MLGRLVQPGLLSSLETLGQIARPHRRRSVGCTECQSDQQKVLVELKMIDLAVLHLQVQSERSSNDLPFRG